MLLSIPTLKNARQGIIECAYGVIVKFVQENLQVNVAVERAIVFLSSVFIHEQ